MGAVLSLASPRSSLAIEGIGGVALGGIGGICGIGDICIGGMECIWGGPCITFCAGAILGGGGSGYCKQNDRPEQYKFLPCI